MDQVYEKGYFEEKFPSLEYQFEEEGIRLQVQGQEYWSLWGDLPLQNVEKLEPNYMIEPNIS